MLLLSLLVKEGALGVIRSRPEPRVVHEAVLGIGGLLVPFSPLRPQLLHVTVRYRVKTTVQRGIVVPHDLDAPNGPANADHEAQL